MSDINENAAPTESSAPAPPPTPARSAEGRLEAQSSISTIGLITGILGATAAVFGAIIYAIDPGASELAKLNLVFAVLAIIVYAVTNKRQLSRVASGRSTPLVLLEIVLAFGVVAAAVAANYFASQSTKEWDLTRDQLYTLQPQSIRVASELTKDVRVIGFYKPTDTPNRDRVNGIVDLFRKHTTHLTAEFVNPDTASPAVAKKYQMSTSSPRIVVVTADDRHTKIKQATEEDLTNALVRVAEKAPSRVYWLSGHGEGSLEDGEADSGFKIAAQALIDEGYEVEALSLVNRENVPKDATTVIVAGAKKPLFANEVQALLAWLRRGGRVLMLLEPGVELGADAIFRPFGVDVGNDLVVDPNPASRALGFGPDAPVVTEFEEHPITGPLKGSVLLFYWVRSVSPRVGVARVETTTLVQTGPTSWGETSYADGGDVARDENDVPGPVPVALATTMKTVTAPEKVNDEARLVVIGDSSFATNRFNSMSGNGDLFLNAVNWLAGEEHRIVVRPKKRGASRIPLTEQQQYGIVFFSVNLLPLLIVGIGFSVWAIRRRK